MIVLDTNVISELMKANPNPALFAWVAARPPEELFTTSLNKAEILYGIAALPEGRRRAALAAAAEAVFTEDLAGRVLPFDATAAERYAEIVVARRQSGRPIEGFDAQIAAIAFALGADVATRDIRDFAGCGLNLIDPWIVESQKGSS
ncbi:MAG TPA: type II toxin-antitoxin system VapC family toxin [Stellaceae bacterium]|nr:type II toxin-antitoxin system VapC family toxin [Stellaceae bacterium]